MCCRLKARALQVAFSHGGYASAPVVSPLCAFVPSSLLSSQFSWQGFVRAEGLGRCAHSSGTSQSTAGKEPRHRNAQWFHLICKL